MLTGAGHICHLSSVDGIGSRWYRVGLLLMHCHILYLTTRRYIAAATQALNDGLKWRMQHVSVGPVPTTNASFPDCNSQYDIDTGTCTAGTRCAVQRTVWVTDNLTQQVGLSSRG